MTAPAPAAGARLSYGPEPLHYGELRLPAGPGPHPVVLALHGGFWRAAYDLTYMGHICAALAAAGVATWNVEYRRVGNPGGGWPGTFHDVARAADYLRTLAPRYRLDLSRVVTLGHSAGGHLALWLAARRRIPLGDALYDARPLDIRGGVALGGVVDLVAAWERHLSNGAVRALMGQSPLEAPGRYATASPMALLPLGVPQLLVHGTDDDTVPYAIAEGYAVAARAAGDTVTLLALHGAGHFEPVDPGSRDWPIVLKAVLHTLHKLSGRAAGADRLP